MNCDFLSVFLNDDNEFNCLSSGIWQIDQLKTLCLINDKYIGNYQKYYMRPTIISVTVTNELDVAYGFCEKIGEVKALLHEVFISMEWLRNKLYDTQVSFVQYKMFEDTKNLTMIKFMYLYIGRYDYKDQIFCFQMVDEENGTIVYVPTRMRHSDFDLKRMFEDLINFRFNS
jgi:hypothetical protein